MAEKKRMEDGERRDVSRSVTVTAFTQGGARRHAKRKAEASQRRVVSKAKALGLKSLPGEPPQFAARSARIAAAAGAYHQPWEVTGAFLAFTDHGHGHGHMAGGMNDTNTAFIATIASTIESSTNDSHVKHGHDALGVVKRLAAKLADLTCLVPVWTGEEA